MSGAKFCAALGVRAGTLPTRLRGSRGRPEADRNCDCCRGNTLESLSHILNVCPRTHGARVKRHDRILAETAKVLTRLGFETVLEPTFKTTRGLRKPDILAYKPDLQSVILDVAVTSDMYDDPNTPHWGKVEYYCQHDEITEGVTATSGCPPQFSALAISWRGCITPQSAHDLRTLGFTKSDLGLLSAITCEQGAIIHRVFNCSTSRRRDFDPP